MSARGLILWFFLWWDLSVSTITFTLWPWPRSLTHFLKTLTLLITFEQWLLELWYFTWIFPLIRPFRGYHYFLTFDLYLGVWPIFLKTLTWLIIFEQWVLELLYFTWVFRVLRPFRGYHYFLHCDLGVWPIFLDNFNLANKFKQWVLEFWYFTCLEYSLW